MIDTKALRSRVLDFAIRGKLTEQFESDGTAEELYQQIQAEKQKLIKEGKIKKEKPLPVIKDEEIPFEIPGNWKWVRLSSIIDVRDGTHDSPKYHSEGIPLITSKNLSSGKLDFENVKLISYEDAKRINERSYVENGDILFAMIGTIGNPVIIDTDKEFCIKNVALFKRYKGSDFNMNYLYYFLLMEQYEMRKITLGGLQPFVSLKLFRSHLVPLPPLAEQKRIVQRVEEIFKLLDTIDAAQEKYTADAESLKVKLITAGIQGKLTEQLDSDGTAEELYQQIQAEKQKLIKEGKIKKEKSLPAISDEEIPFEIPGNWKWVRLGEVFTLQAGKFISAAQISAEQDSDHQYKCFGGNGIRGYVSDYNTNGTHALIGRQGALCGNVNLAHDIFYATEHAVVVYQYCDVDVNWIFYGLTELNLNQYATSVAQPGLAVGKIEKVLIPLPPLAEQKRIADKLNELLETIN